MLPGIYNSYDPQPEYIGSQTFAFDDGNDFTGQTFNVTGAQAGDLIVIAFSFEATADDGWSWVGLSFTDIDNRTAFEDPGSYVGYAIWDGTTTGLGVADVGPRWLRLSICVSVFRNVGTLLSTTTATGGSGNPNGPAASGSGKLHLLTGHLDATSTVTFSAPSGWTLAAQRNYDDGNTAATAIAYNFAGASNPDAFGGGNSGAWRATTTVWT